MDWCKENWVQSESIFLLACRLKKLKLKSPVIIMSEIPVSIASAKESSIFEYYWASEFGGL